MATRVTATGDGYHGEEADPLRPSGSDLLPRPADRVPLVQAATYRPSGLTRAQAGDQVAWTMADSHTMVGVVVVASFHCLEVRQVNGGGHLILRSKARPATPSDLQEAIQYYCWPRRDTAANG